MKILFTCCILFSTLLMHAQESSLGGIWDMGQDDTKIVILKEVKSVSGKWKGRLYSPKKKEWFDAVLKVEGKKLLVTVKSGVMSKTVEWTKG